MNVILQLLGLFLIGVGVTAIIVGFLIINRPPRGQR